MKAVRELLVGAGAKRFIYLAGDSSLDNKHWFQLDSDLSRHPTNLGYHCSLAKDYHQQSNPRSFIFPDQLASGLPEYISETIILADYLPLPLLK
eukprot:2669772-Amphidinium_carterae.1